MRRWSPPEAWRCIEVEGPVAAARQVGMVRVWQDVLDRASAIKRLGDVDVPGYTGLFRVRGGGEADRFYLVCERPRRREASNRWGEWPRLRVEPGHPRARA